MLRFGNISAPPTMVFWAKAGAPSAMVAAMIEAPTLVKRVVMDFLRFWFWAAFLRPTVPNTRQARVSCATPRSIRDHKDVSGAMATTGPVA